MSQQEAYVPKIITLESISSSRQQSHVEPISNETDEEIIDRLRMRFTILEEMTSAVKRGDVRAMILGGAPGIGKSFVVEQVLGKHDLFATLGDTKKPYEIIKGNMSALILYKKLWDNKDAKSIIVIDDCDNLFFDEVSLNILKTALDTGGKRMISWNTDSRYLKDEGIPNVFEYCGGMIFITNIKFANVKSKKLKDHLDALESRCHYLDLTIDTVREKVLRIRQIIGDGGMLADKGFTEIEIGEMLDFICDNKTRMRELSLRSIIKVSELYRSMPKSWREVASLTLLKR